MKKASLNKVAFLLSATITTVVALNAYGSALNIEKYRSGERLECVNMEGDRFVLSFIHSVSLTPVSDSFHLEKLPGGAFQIMQTEERFIAHGQGLPSMSTEPDVTKFEEKDGEFILHLHRKINDLIVRVDHRFKNRLHVGSQVIDLNKWPDFMGLRIRPVKSCN